MKILHVITSVDPTNGGPIEGIRQLGGTLVRQGHQVEIASVDSPSAPWVRNCPLPVHPLGPSKFHYGYGTRLVPWIREHRQSYDAVIVNGLWQFHSFACWQALRRTSTPYVVYTHGMLDPWFKRTFPLKHFKKCFYWPWAEYRVLRDAQAVLFTCEEERILARQSFWLYRCNEVVVNYGTARPSGDPQSQISEFFGRYPDLRGKRIALFMGRVHPKKGCDLLIEAFAKVPATTSEWHLVIAGPDQVGWEKELRKRAETIGIASRITWTGMIAGSLKWGALRAAEILVLPSHQENFGIAVAEALAIGTPTLVSNKVNIWREIEADGAGIVAEDNLSGVCESFRSYLNLPDQKKIAMREFAQRCFEQRFEITKAAGSLKAVLAGLSA